MRVQWRQGDVLFERIESIPQIAVPREGSVLFVGEQSGHAHRLAEGAAATLFETRGLLFLNAAASTHILHEEHRPLVLDAGLYRVWRQREYGPGFVRSVED